MSFWEHLDELRKHLFRSILVVFFFTVLAFLNRNFIFDSVILAPKEADFITNRWLCRLADILSTPSLCMDNMSLTIININLSGQFLTHMYISLAAGIVLGLPYVIWELFRFVKPGMYDNEKRYASGAVIITSILFLIGVLFSYYLIVPLTLNFLGTYQVSSQVSNQIALSSYISTVVSLTFAVGVVFELPVLAYFLTRIGVLTSAFMKKNRKIMIIVILTVAAIITPPDVFSQIMVTIPLLLLYELSILVAKRVERNKEAPAD